MLGGRRTERMETGKWRPSRASRDDSVGVEVEEVTAELPTRSARLRAAGDDGELDDSSGGQELDSPLGLGFWRGGEQWRREGSRGLVGRSPYRAGEGDRHGARQRRSTRRPVAVRGMAPVMALSPQ